MDILKDTAPLFREALERRGFDLTDENLKDTPRRIASVWNEFMQPCNLVEVLKAQFPDGKDKQGLRTMVVQSGIPFQALCMHHFLPFFGEACIGYIPRLKVVGLSKLARLVYHAGRIQPTIQEKVTDLIADTLIEATECVGAIIVIKAVHTCMTVRGIKAEGAMTTTSAVRGIFREVPAARQEFFELIKR